nr:retrovirus-related Pol polyprotein from transposon TNT 1-94 [Tanacetum cinerariifolium]
MDLFGLLLTKDETIDILKKFITEIENLKDLKVKIIRCDNGGEFRNKEINDFCSQKGIKREFSNARTPQQNGVVERRSRTLIEAARTMLADAKLPVTFWAEAVNTACYVQNRVLVNKSQNKTPYELFNGRTPAIGFLRPFGCHVMILNTLDNLGKFEPKRGKGYFIGYLMSSKAFRVFNKRNKKVEENLHVEFLENKAIEKGAGPNWLFDIDSLTKSMNYVPVDAGTNSTNFSGTKDAANQEVKKDVSCLRYIALPNWAYDALLESSSSKTHDESNTKVPKGNGNPNSTDSSSNPPADQMETLTVESLIPTISSPVPTACLNDFLEPSSEARLISKRVTNQKETPSLDNILSLKNRFEDILGVTASSDEAIGVEADVSNMETTISASPTPTLRIHMDHPKSQIIGHVDTPIQTRHKSKKGSSHNKIDDKGYWDSGCSRHMTGNISYLFDFEPYDGGYVSFGQRGCKITGKGTIKTGKLEFENVYFVKDIKYNLFSVSQIYDNKNSILFNDSECIVLERDFKLLDDANILLRTPRQHNMYSIDLNNIVPHKDLTCLVAKASDDECILWHRRLVTDDFSRFTWTFFLKSKNETSGILKKFINEIENLKDLKVKIIRCNNEGEFRNKEMIDFFSQKGIKREFSNARTPQQNGVAERRNRT